MLDSTVNLNSQNEISIFSMQLSNAIQKTHHYIQIAHDTIFTKNNLTEQKNSLQKVAQSRYVNIYNYNDCLLVFFFSIIEMLFYPLHINI